MKCTRKLCNNDTAKKIGEDGYNPAYKYDYLFNVICHNVNATTCYADLDLCRDKTTFRHNGYGEPGSGFFGRVKDKPGVSKGGQIILLSEISRVMPCAYLHCHKLHKLPPGWTVMGQYEVGVVLEWLKPMIQGEASDSKKYSPSIHVAPRIIISAVIEY
eukprot:3530556-Ditylum_brightwellii.AAC.1